MSPSSQNDVIAYWTGGIYASLGSVTGNTVGTSIAAALASATSFEKNQMGQQKESLNNHANKAPTLEEACR
ncbi:hypothetical protein BGAL_0553g00030 [Botrytis galanthina]|uniref:Uncharacterized protein n=1 Tax=Botrytis galanthina TaxID=278940 RepID=A0A4S8QVZ2_9HELO|nr:hypothetical protein BGAL_0553g00030 [Botrytis galanthina]